MEPFWLEMAKRIQAIAQSGLAYCKDPFDRERFQELREISARMISHYSETEMKIVRDLFLNETGYQTPKIDVRAVIFNNNHILLVKEKSDGKWTLPGGWAEPGLSLGENIVKEVKEESGYEVKAERVLAVLTGTDTITRLLLIPSIRFLFLPDSSGASRSVVLKQKGLLSIRLIVFLIYQLKGLLRNK